METAKPLIDIKRHTVKTSWPPNPVQVEVDPIRMVQIVTNLLTNAAKYTDPEGLISFTARTDGRLLTLSVRDTGIGLAPHMLTDVFEMFAQVAPEQNRTEGGLGIGLALVKGLVGLHGRRVEAHSDGLERGSEFTVTLPEACVEDSGQTNSGGHEVGLPSTGLKRVLIADDNLDGAESLGMLIESSGHQVYLAHTGVDAYETAASRRPDVAILDIGMPGMDGYQVALKIRSQPWGARMTLIAVTGWGQEDDKRRARDAGFDHHMTKPVDPARLEEMLGTLT